jgi:hypothetical protein
VDLSKLARGSCQNEGFNKLTKGSNYAYGILRMFRPELVC